MVNTGWPLVRQSQASQAKSGILIGQAKSQAKSGILTKIFVKSGKFEIITEGNVHLLNLGELLDLKDEVKILY